ncbi:MAG TPA: hypothetical protein VI233_12855 [Puia sp.]
MDSYEIGEDEEDISVVWFQQGVPEAFKLFFFQYYPELFRFARVLVQDRLTTQRLCMDAFFLCFDRRADLSSDEKIKSFLYLAVRNNCMDHIRWMTDPANADKPEPAPIPPPAALPRDIVRDLFEFAAVGLR